MVKKSANEKLYGSKDLPKIVDLFSKPDAMKRLGGRMMLVASPLQYNAIMSTIPVGKVITLDRIRDYLAKEAKADLTCPLTSGMFTNLCAQASEERNEHKLAWWRTLKKDGQLNEKYPQGMEEQKQLLECEGHSIIKKGSHYYVANYAEKLYQLK